MKCVDLLCRRLNREGVKVCAIDWWKVAVDVARGETSSAEPFGHGGEVITSIALALELILSSLQKPPMNLPYQHLVASMLTQSDRPLIRSMLISENIAFRALGEP